MIYGGDNQFIQNGVCRFGKKALRFVTCSVDWISCRYTPFVISFTIVSYSCAVFTLSKVTRDDLEKSKRERAAAAKKRGKVTSEETESLAAQMPPPMEVVGQEQDEIWKLQAQVGTITLQFVCNCLFEITGN